ncbi:hypothetical protein X961_5884 [Burkholderia pseudomallei MSHR5613]|nr:hypothetical protein X948_5631 [Burkholderia pseudomallei MSHR5608]KGS16652.1 hypothetical protein X989_5874 [Burkholderia pseudomallei MSHR4378]KGS38784.1 hypothetical protein X961_5884 [Burkholderia pseudomallei MSHR5613]
MTFDVTRRPRAADGAAAGSGPRCRDNGRVSHVSR